MAGHQRDQIAMTRAEAAAFLAGSRCWSRPAMPTTPARRLTRGAREGKSYVEQLLHKRVVVRLDVDRLRSWDHHKLGLPVTALAGVTAAP